MEPNTTGQAGDMVGKQVADRAGETIGTVEEVILDKNTGDPEWLAVKLANVDRAVAVPLGGVVESGAGGVVFFAERAVVEHAPQVVPRQGLDSDEEGVLYEYYGLQRPYIRERAEQLGVTFLPDGTMLAPPRGTGGTRRPSS